MKEIYLKMTNVEDVKLHCSKCHAEILPSSTYYDHIGKIICSVDCIEN